MKKWAFSFLLNWPWILSAVAVAPKLFFFIVKFNCKMMMMPPSKICENSIFVFLLLTVFCVLKSEADCSTFFKSSSQWLATSVESGEDLKKAITLQQGQLVWVDWTVTMHVMHVIIGSTLAFGCRGPRFKSRWGEKISSFVFGYTFMLTL